MNVEIDQIKKQSRIENDILELIEPEIFKLGFQLWDLLWIPSQRILRVFISKPDMAHAVSLGDCQSVSRGIDGMIEASQILSDKYYLEVSSLGEAPYIRTWVQLSRFKAQKLEFTDMNGKKQTGILEKVEHGGAFLWRPDLGRVSENKDPIKSHISDYQRIRAKKAKSKKPKSA
jgi:ribosome maturation factor RimP